MANTQVFVQATNGVTNSQVQWVSDLVSDLTALRSAITTLTAKLDLDGGVTDTNYATLCNPAALRTSRS
jgi:hypothetical protein